MSNPYRFIFNKQFFVRPFRKSLDTEKQQIKLEAFEDSFECFYDVTFIDLYSAPDLCMSYTNGNNTKDEWIRLEQWSFNNLELLQKYSENGYDDNKIIIAQYQFKQFQYKFYDWNDLEQYLDVPMGKFYGMTIEQVKEYKKNNVFLINKKATAMQWL